MRSHGASLVRASAALALATAAGAADRPGAEPFDEALARGAREPLEAIVRAYQATEPPAPLDAAQVGVVAAWEIARDAGTHGVARYEALAATPGDPKRALLRAICERVLELALIDPDVETRKTVVEEIEATELALFIEPLDRVVEQDTIKDVRGAASHAIRRIGGRKARATLRANLRHADPEVRKLAADELARMNDLSALRYLRREARTGTRDDKLWAVVQLGRLGDPTAFTVADALIQDPEEWYRVELVQTLDKYDDPRTIPVLRIGLEDPSPDVRLISAGALADLDDATGLPVLREMARSRHNTQRTKAFDKLAELDDRASIPLIREALADSSELVRDQAAAALEKLGDPEGRAYVTKKRGALGSLGALAGALLAGRRGVPDQPPPPPPEATIEARTADKYERAQSIRTLSEMGSAGLAGLRTGLADPDPLVRRLAARGIGKTGRAADVSQLVPLLGDPQRAVRFASAGAILTLLAR